MNTRLHNTYIGVGSSAPPPIIERATLVAKQLACHHYQLRSDGEAGVSSIFDSHSPHSEIYLPHRDYLNHSSTLCKSSREAEYIASKYHPSYDALSTLQRKIVNRYSHVVLGKDLREPALFAVIFSEDGAQCNKERTAQTGIVGHVICLCESLSIPIFNLARDDSLLRMEKRLGIDLS